MGRNRGCLSLSMPIDTQLTACGVMQRDLFLGICF